MGVQVTLDYPTWAALFTEFSVTVNETQWGLWLNVLTSTLVANDGTGPVTQAQTQTTLLQFALAHLLFLYLGTNTQPAAETVGRINSAAEGSVNVATDYGQNISASQAFWVQSKYGAIYWQMTNIYRRFIYNPGTTGPQPVFPFGPGTFRP
jgi:hypothetical protein